MHIVSLPESGRHLWELTEPASSCLALLHYWAWFATETTALELQSLQIKTLSEREHTSDNSLSSLRVHVSHKLWFVFVCLFLYKKSSIVCFKVHTVCMLIQRRLQTIDL